MLFINHLEGVAQLAPHSSCTLAYDSGHYVLLFTIQLPIPQYTPLAGFIPPPEQLQLTPQVQLWNKEAWWRYSHGDYAALLNATPPLKTLPVDTPVHTPLLYKPAALTAESPQLPPPPNTQLPTQAQAQAQNMLTPTNTHDPAPSQVTAPAPKTATVTTTANTTTTTATTAPHSRCQPPHHSTPPSPQDATVAATPTAVTKPKPNMGNSSVTTPAPLLTASPLLLGGEYDVWTDHSALILSAAESHAVLVNADMVAKANKSTQQLLRAQQQREQPLPLEQSTPLFTNPEEPTANAGSSDLSQDVHRAEVQADSPANDASTGIIPKTTSRQPKAWQRAALSTLHHAPAPAAAYSDLPPEHKAPSLNPHQPVVSDKAKAGVSDKSAFSDAGMRLRPRRPVCNDLIVQVFTCVLTPLTLEEARTYQQLLAHRQYTDLYIAGGMVSKTAFYNARPLPADITDPHLDLIGVKPLKTIFQHTQFSYVLVLERLTFIASTLKNRAALLPQALKESSVQMQLQRYLMSSTASTLQLPAALMTTETQGKSKTKSAVPHLHSLLCLEQHFYQHSYPRLGGKWSPELDFVLAGMITPRTEALSQKSAGQQQQQDKQPWGFNTTWALGRPLQIQATVDTTSVTTTQTHAAQHNNSTQPDSTPVLPALSFNYQQDSSTDSTRSTHLNPSDSKQEQELDVMALVTQPPLPVGLALPEITSWLLPLSSDQSVTWHGSHGSSSGLTSPVPESNARLLQRPHASERRSSAPRRAGPKCWEQPRGSRGKESYERSST